MLLVVDALLEGPDLGHDRSELVFERRAVLLPSTALMKSKLFFDTEETPRLASRAATVSTLIVPDMLSVVGKLGSRRVVNAGAS